MISIRIFQRLKRWLAYINSHLASVVLWIGAVSYTLLLSGIIDNWKILIGLAIPTLGGFVALILGLSKSQELIKEDLDAKLDRVIQALPKDLLTSEQCFKDLDNELRRLQKLHGDMDGLESPITIRLLGLDLGQGRRYLQKIIKGPPVNPPLHFQVLVITNNWADIAPRLMCRRLKETEGPSRLRQWCTNSTGTVASIRETVTQMEPSLPNVSLEIRSYSEWPVIHGIAIVHPVEIVYFTFCRWSGHQYDSGLSEYRKIKDPPPGSDKADCGVVFCSFFRHLWESTDTKVLYSLPPESIRSESGAP